MEVTSSKPGASFVSRLVKLPLQVLWFLIKHPILTMFIALLITFSTVSFLAHFNPAIADRFNNAAGSFMGATLLHEASDLLRKTKSDLGRVNADLEGTKGKLKTAAGNLEGTRGRLKTTQADLKAANAKIVYKDLKIRGKSRLLKEKDLSLGEVNGRLNKFRVTGKHIEKSISGRFRKIVITDAAGEVIGFIPFLGDAASLGLAANGIYEMCQMLKEIEEATDDLGAKLNVYTNTFCEKPAEKSAEILEEATKDVKNSFNRKVKTISFKIKNLI
jgi:hypothetical protein